jgi:hypothetical protein
MLIALFMAASMFSPLLFLLLVLIFILIFNGSIYTAVWAMDIGGIIARERERSTYDVYCMAPEGALGVNWAVCTGYLQRYERLEQLRGLVGRLLLVLVGVVALVTFFIVTNAGNTSPFAQAERDRAYLTLIHMGTIVAALYIDHAHSIILGCLVGMLMPTYLQGHLDTRFGTIGVYLLMQLGTYVLTWLIALLALPAAFGPAPIWLARAALAVLQLAVFYAVREVIIQVLWRKLLEQLNVAPAELDAMAPRARP